MPARIANASHASRKRSSKNASADREIGLEIVAEPDPLTVHRREPAEQGRPIAADRAQVGLVAAVVPRQRRVAAVAAPGVREVRDAGKPDTELTAPRGELGQPPEDVAAAVAARHPPDRADAQEDVAARRAQLLDELHAGLGRSDDEDGTGRQVIRPTVVVRVDAQHTPRQPSGQRRDVRRVEAADRHDRLPGAQRAVARLQVEPVVAQGEASHLDAEPDRRTDPVRVGRDPADDLVAGHVAVRVVVVVRGVGEGGGPVRPDEAEVVPAVLRAAAQRRASLEHEVVAATSLEVPARGQAGLAGPDDDGVDPLRKRHPRIVRCDGRARRRVAGIDARGRDAPGAGRARPLPRPSGRVHRGRRPAPGADSASTIVPSR